MSQNLKRVAAAIVCTSVCMSGLPEVKAVELSAPPITSETNENQEGFVTDEGVVKEENSGDLTEIEEEKEESEKTENSEESIDTENKDEIEIKDEEEQIEEEQVEEQPVVEEEVKPVLIEDIAVPYAQGIEVDYNITPAPQELVKDGGTVQITSTITAVVGDNVSERVKNRIKEVFYDAGYGVDFSDVASEENSNINISIYDENTEYTFPTDIIEKDDLGAKGQENAFDAHVIQITDGANGSALINVCGESDDAAFYALATLEQILAQSSENDLTKVTIKDSADMQYRGVIEGYYGRPYSKEDLLSFFEYGKHYKMNTFLYAPKTDPYHLGTWRDEYPTNDTITEEERANGVFTQEDFVEICEAAQAAGIQFVWSVHPMMQQGIDLTDPASIEDGKKAIINKFSHMYDLGVRQFGLLVDDIDMSLAIQYGDRQAKLVDDVYKELAALYNTEDAALEDTIKPLFYVPTSYTLADGGIDSVNHLKDVDPNIVVTFTGADVWGGIINSDMQKMYDRIGRKPHFWWNSPVNDAFDERLFIGPIDMNLPVDTDVVDCMGVMSNPMSYAEASKVYLYGVLDYSWNVTDFDVNESWDEAIESLFPEDKKLTNAFRIFAEHSIPSENKVNGPNSGKPYTDYSGADKLINELKSQDITRETAKPLMDNMKEWADACEYLHERLGESNDPQKSNLYKEIKPWIYKSEVLAKATYSSLEAIVNDDVNAFFDATYQINRLGSDPLLQGISMEGAGTAAYERTWEALAGGKTLVDYLNNELYPKAKEVMADSLPTLGDKTLSVEKLTNIADSSSINVEEREDSFVISGLEGKTFKPEEYIGISFGNIPLLRNIGNIVAPEGMTVQYSLNGRTWKPISEADSETPISAIRIINTKTSDITVSVDSVKIDKYNNPYSSASVETTIKTYQSYNINRLLDGNWTSHFWSGESPKEGSTITVNYNDAVPVKNIRMVVDKAGDIIDVPVLVEISSDGDSWKEVGTLNEDIIIQDAEKNGVGYGAYVIDGINSDVKSVRLTFKGNNNAWIKFYEFEVNTVASAVYSTESGRDAAFVSDNNVLTGFRPDRDKADSVTYQTINPEKVGEITVIMKASRSGLPKAEVLSGDEWVEVELVESETFNNLVYIANVSNINNVTNFRLSWTEDNAPYSIFDISYSTINTTNPDVEAVAKLRETYLKALEAKKGDYTTTAWENLQKEIEKAYNLLNGEATTEDYQNATISLENAIEDKGSSSGGSSSSSSSSKSYEVIVDDTENGKVSVSDSKAKKGTTVTVKVTPDEGYTVDKILVTASNDEIDVTKKSDTEYTFTMPGSAVNVEVSFVKGDSQTIDDNDTPLDEKPEIKPVQFTDVNENSWYYKAVSYVNENGLMNGVSDTRFAPDSNLTRAMLVQILYNKEGKPAVTSNGRFIDVLSNQWYANAVNWAASNNIVSGISQNMFAPDLSITREQLATILYRYAGSPAVSETELNFKDASSVSDYAVNAMKWAVENKIVSGNTDGTLAPKNKATRAEVAQIIMNYCENIK